MIQASNVTYRVGKKALFEEVPPHMRDYILNLIRNFEMLLEKQDLRRITKYKKFVEQMIDQLQGYDPLAEQIIFTDFEESEEFDIEDSEEDEEEDDDDGGFVWTS